MLRLIIRTDDAHMAANAGGAVLTTYQTFDVDLPDVERALRDGGRNEGSFRHRQLVGCELIEERQP